MHETAEDLADLQRMLDDSYAAAGEHLRGIFRPDNLCSAPDLVDALQGVFLIHLATVTAKGEPIVAPLDGLFYRGRLFFGLPPGSVRARHLRARPQVSVTHTIGEDFVVIVHGVDEEVTAGHPLHDGYGAFAREVYGLPAIEFNNEVLYADRKGPEFNGFVAARRMFAQGKPPNR